MEDNKMKKIHENTHTHAWENEQGLRIIASRANTNKGIYWTVTFIRKPKDFDTLGTRCTWEQVLTFLNQYL